MLMETDLSNQFPHKPETTQTSREPLDLENPDSKSHLFDKGRDKPSKSGSSAPQELTLSYLCDNPKLVLQENDVSEKIFLSSLEKSRCKGKEIVSDLLVDDERRWIERDFLQLNGGINTKGSLKRETSEGIDGENLEKKVKIETLNLSLGLPNLSLSLNSSNPLPNTVIPNLPNSVPPKRSYSNNTRTTNSDDYAASLSYSYSVPFSHNPSCSLTRNSTENYEHSRENDQIWYCGGEGTNGSVHSRFKPVGDSNNVSFSNHNGYPRLPSNNNELNNVLYRSNGSENHSFFPSELPARLMKDNGNGLANSDSGRNVMLTRPDRVLREIVSESVHLVAQMLQELPSDSLESVKECLRNLMDTPEKEEFASLQRKLERRSDLVFESLSKSHKTQLEILVTVKTGIVDFLSAKSNLSTTELVEIFLLSRCRNMNCKSILPVDDCDCNICSNKKGFCSSCMCPICLKFDCALNTCSWVGCDVCSHWCHAVCGIQKNLIKPGPSSGGAVGTTEMQFHCLGCGHASEMFGFVKEVFICCAKTWSLEALIKELGCVRKIFRGSEDFNGRELQRKAEEMLTLLTKKLISPSDACNSVLQFLEHGVPGITVSGISSRDTITAQASQRGDVHPLPPPPTIIPPKSTFNLKSASSRLDSQRDAPKTEPKIPASERHFDPPTEGGFQSLETIVRFKEAEAKLFQRLADDAKREVEGYLQIARAKSEKLEEEYTNQLTKLCLKETEERRRKKLEELKLLENSNSDYYNMKVRMRAEIAGLLERMESTKRQLL